MALKDILVHVDNSKACRKRLETAVALASAHDAHLTGVYVLQSLALPSYAEAEIGPEFRRAQQEAREQRAREAEELFNDVTRHGGAAAEWRAAEGVTGHTLVQHGRYADVVIIGQPQADDGFSVDMGSVNDVILQSGRPVLVIPYIGAQPTLGTQVLVSWNASREAVRAVNDAIPLLGDAQKVHVMAVNPPGGSEGEGEIPCADICLHLARHGVRAEAHPMRARDIEVGDMVLSRASDEGVDLIVMGAWGHSRFREVVLGGATRHLLEHMTVPVLMSH